ncbi:aminotransferase class V-fold PLP-dependent enzyme [Thermogemmatispora sp.]|uniref:aminotransferase class V-fold PLP-dependent enzyme n=1 Tax=Thermogemmatispora sp. TaxID=1968838 RepID=UPI001DBAC449|nr:aminotransferase class V-fold PLP-dependent enzyme [Thermogemmatispora sp.]MBX5448494.1 aminotransferase class V-fold PLP-dependent enzyme [Thermogemmatispora sp.]
MHDSAAVEKLQAIREAMPATTAHTYLNTGTFGPLPSCVIEAMRERLQAEWRQGRLGAEAQTSLLACYREARRRCAELLNASEDEIALTDNTGEGLNIIAFGLNWREGDEVITTNHEHISALAPLYQLRDRYGIGIRIADLGERGERAAEEEIAKLITPRTRLIVLSHVSFMTGARFDVSAVTALGRRHGLPVLVDGAQAAGAIAVDVQELEVDFYAFPMHKWLCGPDGTGGLYVRRTALAQVQPTYVGYYSLKHEQSGDWELHETAQRFELGGRQTAALVGQSRVLRWLAEEVGHHWLRERIASLNRYAADLLRDVPGVRLLTPQPGASGLLSFTFERAEPEAVVRRLAQEHNVLIRSIHERQALRLSTGFYNTEEELERVARILRTWS